MYNPSFLEAVITSSGDIPHLSVHRHPRLKRNSRKNGGGTIHAQARPQKSPPAEDDSKDKSLRRVYTIQQRGDTPAGCLDGDAPDVQGAPRPMHEESQGSPSQTPNSYKDIRGCSGECESHPNCLCPSGRTIWERALLGSQRSRQTKRPSNSLKSTSQIRSGGAAHDPTGALMREAELTPTPVILDSRQQ